MESLSDATAAELGEVSFQLPAEPLAPTMALLLGAVRELQRAGGPTLPPPARDRLAGKLLVRPPALHPGIAEFAKPVGFPKIPPDTHGQRTRPSCPLQRSIGISSEVPGEGGSWPSLVACLDSCMHDYAWEQGTVVHRPLHRAVCCATQSVLHDAVLC